MIRTACLAGLVALTVVGGGGQALADTLTPQKQEIGVISEISAGIAEIGIENLLILTINNNSADGLDVSSTSVSFIGGPTFRYFVMNNLSVGLNVNLLLQSSSVETTTATQTTNAESSEVGVLGTVMADYYVNLGRGMFLKPGIGGGGFYTSTDLPVAEGSDVVQKASASGGVVRAQLGFVYYTSRHFNLRAGIDALMLFGSRTTDNSDVSVDVFELDLGWNVGFSYVF